MVTNGASTRLFRGITLLIYIVLAAAAFMFATQAKDDAQNDKAQMINMIAPK